MLCAWNTHQGICSPYHPIWRLQTTWVINNANKLCHPGSQPRGIILLGDSAGAHFHISPEWITASQMSLVSNFGSNHPGCAGLCVCSPLALSKCDASSKQVQISLLSKICYKRHIHSHFNSVHFKQCDKKCEATVTTGSSQESSCPLEKGDNASAGWKGDLGTMGKSLSYGHLRHGSLLLLQEPWNSAPEKSNYRNYKFFLDPFFSD